MDTAADDSATTGKWREGKNVLWSDLLAPFHAFIFWAGLLLIAFLVVLSATKFNMRLVANSAGQMNSPAVAQFISGTLYLTTLFFLWRIARRVSDDAMIARYRPANARTVLLAVLLGVVFAAGTMVALSYLVTHGVVKFQPRPSDRMFVKGSILQYPIVIVVVSLVAPLVEEFYFRGVLLSWLKRKITLIPAILVTSALFGLVHFRFLEQPGLGGWVLTAVVTFAGLLSAIFAVRTRTLWPSFGLHAAYNGTLAGFSVWAMLAK